MGLDTVELVMEIEEAFGISIPDDQASRMLTVGDGYDFLLEATAYTNLKASCCLSAAAFYELRRQLRSLGVPNNAIRPGSMLAQVIPSIGRRSCWKTLNSRMDLQFPRLRRPLWLAFLNCTLVAIIVFGAFSGFAKSSVFIGAVGAVLIGVASTFMILLLTRPFAIYPAATCLSIRELVTQLVTLNYNSLATRYSSRSPSDIWNALQLIVAEQLGIDRSAVVRQARFVQDLGAS